MAQVPHFYQLDIPYADAKFMNIPRFMPGRVNADDFVYFKWPRHFDSSKYSILVEPNDTAGSRFRTLGRLGEMVPLPAVYFNAESRIGVVPTSDSRLASYWSTLNRASTYVIPDIDYRKGGQFVMDRHGILTAAVSDYKLV